jgi:hypothetical protein
MKFEANMLQSTVLRRFPLKAKLKTGSLKCWEYRLLIRGAITPKQIQSCYKFVDIGKKKGRLVKVLLKIPFDQATQVAYRS